MAEGYTDITVVVDKSSSMASQIGPTIEGFNTFLAEQQKAEGKATISLIQFGSDIQIDFEGIDVQDARELTEETYVPNGMTALNDALGNAILRAQKRHRAMAEADRPHKTIIVVLTDGGENDSKEFGGPQGLQNLKTLIERQQTDGWNFIFLGQDLNAQQAAQSYAIPQANALSYKGSSRGIGHAYYAASNAVAGTRAVVHDAVAAMDSSSDFMEMQEQARSINTNFRAEDLALNDAIMNGTDAQTSSETSGSSGT